jgi:phosphonate transport system substrate-binding protein
VEPVLVKTNLEGSFACCSIGVARADSGITSVADMRGKGFGCGDPTSASGDLIPLVGIPQEGYPMAPGAYFADVMFTGGHEQTIVAVGNGDVDAGPSRGDGHGDREEGCNSGPLRRAADAPRVDRNDRVRIWQPGPIPEGPIVLRRALPQEVRGAMIRRLSEMQANDPACACNIAAGEAAGFTPIGHEACESIIAVRLAQQSN